MRYAAFEVNSIFAYLVDYDVCVKNKVHLVAVIIFLKTRKHNITIAILVRIVWCLKAH